MAQIVRGDFRAAGLDFVVCYKYIPDMERDATRGKGRRRAAGSGPASSRAGTAPDSAGPGADSGAARFLLDGIQLLVRRFAVSERADVTCCGLSVAQAATLDVLRTEGPVRLSALGRRLGIAPSTLTRNLDRLEKAGHVVRESDGDDARAARVRLTATGRGAAAEVERRELAFARGVLERLPRERRAAALEGLRDLLAAVREATEGCCPGAFDHLMKDFPASRCGADGC
jgi:DNA-binding MarR family transcriptional regulator